MKRYHYYVTVSVIAILWCACLSHAAEPKRVKPKTWLCYYGDTFRFRHYSDFDLVVFDGRNHPSLRRKGDGAPAYLGYLSLGEIHDADPLWPFVKDKHYLLHKNEDWNSRLVDVRDPAWQSLIIEKAIKGIFDRGFDGLFIDTIDSALSLQLDGTEEAVLHIIRGIRKAYPGKLLAVNRGLPMLPCIAPFIDLVVIEDLYSYYSFEERRYMKVTRKTRNILLKQVAAGLKAAENLTVLTLDYAGPGQRTLADEAIAFSRRHGFIPYVSTYRLDEIFYYTLQQ